MCFNIKHNTSAFSHICDRHVIIVKLYGTALLTFVQKAKEEEWDTVFASNSYTNIELMNVIKH